MEEKYGHTTAAEANGSSAGVVDEHDADSDSSSDSEEEDDEGVLASGVLDEQVQATLDAIRQKDPRVYDQDVQFYTSEEALPRSNSNSRIPKPIHLSEYHRRNLLDGGSPAAESALPSYAEQQERVKDELVEEMHAAVERAEDGKSDGDEGNDEFLVAKAPSHAISNQTKHTKDRLHESDVAIADQDPQNYLSRYVSSRAWVPTESSKFQPFESDDEEEDQKAEDFEEAYNLRFEDPTKSNEVLMSHARDTAARYSVRKEDLNPRKRARETERAKKEAARQVRSEEKARFRKLKIAEAEARVTKIQEAAGFQGSPIGDEEWSAFLEEGWSDDQWEKKMSEKFGANYYADRDDHGDSEGEAATRKLKKPRWEDDIEIDDIVPQFTSKEETNTFDLAADSDPDEAPSRDPLPNAGTDTGQKLPRNHREEIKKEKRQQRRKIERIVDGQMETEERMSNFSKKHSGFFRYRDTSPTTFGMDARDILMASDGQLNQYAGLKKMAAFRDADKKRKDKKKLGKKARLRQWRKDTFGSEEGPRQSFAELLTGHDAREIPLHQKGQGHGGVDVKSRKRGAEKK